jgi:hypothetical protein
MVVSSRWWWSGSSGALAGDCNKKEATLTSCKNAPVFRFERYKAGRTLAEVAQLGASAGDITHDVGKGFLVVEGLANFALMGAQAEAGGSAVAAGNAPPSKATGKAAAGPRKINGKVAAAAKAAKTVVQKDPAAFPRKGGKGGTSGGGAGGAGGTGGFGQLRRERNDRRAKFRDGEVRAQARKKTSVVTRNLEPKTT